MHSEEGLGSDKDSKIKHIGEQVANLEKALDDAQDLATQSNADKDSDFEKLRKVIAVLQNEIEVLTCNVEKVQHAAGQKLATLESKLCETSNISQILRKQVAMKDAKIQGAEQAATQRQSESVDVKTQHDMQIVLVKSQLEQAAQKLKEELGKLEQSQSKLFLADSKNVDLASTVALINKAKDTLSEQLKVKDEELYLLEHEARILKGKLRDISDQAMLRAHQDAKNVADVKKEMDTLQQVKASIERNLDSTQKASSLALASKQSEIRRLTADLARSSSYTGLHERDDVTRLKSTIQDNIVALANNKAEIERLHTQFHRLHAEKDKVLHGLKDECDSLKYQVAQHEDESALHALALLKVALSTHLLHFQLAADSAHGCPR